MHHVIAFAHAFIGVGMAIMHAMGHAFVGIGAAVSNVASKPPGGGW